MDQQVPTICLNMIVKNERDKMVRCLSSVVSHIDYWVISDTGSTDGTQDIIREFFSKHNVPGEIVHHEWKNFRDNRNMALQAAKGKADYIMFLDADMELRVNNKDFKKKLNKVNESNRYYNTNKLVSEPANLFRIYQGQTKKYYNVRIIQDSKDFKYESITHEVLVPNFKGCIESRFHDIYFYDHQDGTNRKEKYTRDIKLLKQGLDEEPNNTRYFFYLGQSYYEINKFDEAIKWYTKRAEAGGWYEEVFYSYMMIANAMKFRGDDTNKVIQMYIKSYNKNKARLEPIYEALKLLNNKRRHKEAYDLGMKLKVIDFKFPENDLLFVKTDIYQYKAIDEFATACYWVGDYIQALRIWVDELLDNRAPDYEVPRIKKNINHCYKGLEKIQNKN